MSAFDGDIGGKERLFAHWRGPEAFAVTADDSDFLHAD